MLDVATEVEKFLLKNFALAYRLRLRYNEQLSAIDLVKRAATKEAFPSVTRVALDPWIRGVGKDNLTLIADLCNKLLEHSEKEDKAQVSGNGWRYSGIYQDFSLRRAVAVKRSCGGGATADRRTGALE